MKFRVILLSFLLFAFSWASVSSAEESTNVYFLLRGENFTLPSVVGTWSIQPNAMIYAGGIPGTYLRNSSASEPPATAKIYIEHAGDYVIWGLSADSQGAATDRHCKIGFDNTYDDVKYGSDVAGFSWTRSSKTYSLAAGWHTINVKTGYPTMSLAAVMITNDLSYTLTTSVPYANISIYEDKVAPVIDTDITTEYIDNRSCKIIYPSAIDTNGIFEYSCYVNNESVTLAEDGSYLATGLKPLQTIEIKLKVADRYGNSATKMKTILSSPLDVQNFVIKDASGNTVTNLAQLSSSASAQVSANCLNRTADTKNVMLSIALYTKDYERMVGVGITESALFATGSYSNITALLTLPEDVKANPQNYVLSAMLWDTSGHIEPYAVGINFGG